MVAQVTENMIKQPHKQLIQKNAFQDSKNVAKGDNQDGTTNISVTKFSIHKNSPTVLKVLQPTTLLHAPSLLQPDEAETIPNLLLIKRQ